MLLVPLVLHVLSAFRVLLSLASAVSMRVPPSLARTVPKRVPPSLARTVPKPYAFSAKKYSF